MSSKEKQLFLEHWTQVRRKGMWLYVLTTAVSWGTYFALFMRFFNILIDRGGISLPLIRSAFLSREFLLYWGAFLLGGLAYAVFAWLHYDRRYRKLSAEIDAQPESKSA